MAMLGVVAGTVIWLTISAGDGERQISISGPAVVLSLAEGSPADRRPPRAGSTPESTATGGAPIPALTPPRRDMPLPEIVNDPVPTPVAKAPVAKPPVAKTKAPKVVARVSEPPAAEIVDPDRKSTRPRPVEPKVAVERETPKRAIVAPGRRKLPRVSTGPPLRAAPDPALVQKSDLGLLPIISSDGRKPWRVYARPFSRTDRRPRVAIVISGLGLSSAATDTAIQSLPGGITLAFAPYADRLDEWIRLARAAGHEVLLSVPMEPINYPEFDPGPQVLLTTLSSTQNLDRLLWTLGRVTGYVGVTDFMGSRFTMSRAHLRPVLAALNERGLMFVDSRTARHSQVPNIAREVGIPWASNTRFIDDRASRDRIDQRLKELERTARAKGRAIGMGSPFPVTLERIAVWVRGLKGRGIALAPVSALAEIGPAG